MVPTIKINLSFMNTESRTFHVHGMHCKACEILIEGELAELEQIDSVRVNLARHTVTVTGSFGEMPEEEIVKLLHSVLQGHGYSVSTEKTTRFVQWSDFQYAIPIAFVFILFFVLLQKMGIVNLIGTGDISYGTVFIIGIVASLSSCMAVVGGLVLSMSATFAKEGSNTKPQILFHIGRLISFFILGGVIGVIGTAFTLNVTTSFILSMIVGIVMLILGINLLDVFHRTKALQLSMPRFISEHALGITKLNHTLTPFLVGAVTFFLPCGFTQSMQVYSLSAGGFLGGGLTMFIFALGTLPILALVSFSSLTIQKSSMAGVFFKTAGLIVIAFAVMNIINSFVVIGLLSPVFTF